MDHGISIWLQWIIEIFKKTHNHDIYKKSMKDRAVFYILIDFAVNESMKSEKNALIRSTPSILNEAFRQKYLNEASTE